MTLRLSTLFEDNMKPLMSGYKSAKRRGDNDCTPRKRGPPPRRPTRAVNGTGYHQSGEEDDENDDDYTETKSRAQRSRRHNTNGVSSSNIDDQPGPSRRSRRVSLQLDIKRYLKNYYYNSSESLRLV